MLNYQKYEKTGGELTVVATVKQDIGKGGSIKFVPGTIDRFKNKLIKSLNLILMKKDGTSTTCPLSKKASLTVINALANGTTKKEVLGAIMKLEIMETEDGKNYICPPMGSGGEEETLTFEEGAKVSASYEDFVY
jgi:hypothetical protein